MAGEAHMFQLIEFYEMVSLNDAALSGAQRKAISRARFALHVFEKAMQGFRTQFSEAHARTSAAAGRWPSPAASGAPCGREDLEVNHEILA